MAQEQDIEIWTEIYRHFKAITSVIERQKLKKPEGQNIKLLPPRPASPDEFPQPPEKGT